jgi:hypothetical protein
MGQQTDGTRRRSPGITNIIDTALIGISTVVVVQLLQGTSTDIPLFISLYAFAGAIPMLGRELSYLGSNPLTNSPQLHGRNMLQYGLVIFSRFSESAR